MLNVKKQPGSVLHHNVAPEDLALINAQAKAELSAEEVYTFAVRLCDNEIDRDFERFDRSALETLGKLFVGKSGIFDHNWTAMNQTARLYRTELCRGEGVTAAGDPAFYLKGYAYMLRSEKNRELIEEIEAGIKKEVSIGCSVSRQVCSICGEAECHHQRGQRYGGKLCFFTLEAPTDAYEWSFVAVPAQRSAGVIKAFSQEEAGRLRRALSAHPGCLEHLEALEREAALGRSYMKGLRKELVRLAGLADEELDTRIFASAVEKLEEAELLELSRVYQKRLDARSAPLPQLRHTAEPRATAGDEDRAYLI